MSLARGCRWRAGGWRAPIPALARCALPLRVNGAGAGAFGGEPFDKPGLSYELRLNAALEATSAAELSLRGGALTVRIDERTVRVRKADGERRWNRPHAQRAVALVVFADGALIELFVDGSNYTTSLFGDPASDGIRFNAPSGRAALLSAALWPMRNIGL